MKSIKIKKVKIHEVMHLQQLLLKYIVMLNKSLKNNCSDIGPCIIAIDLSSTICLNFRKKIEARQNEDLVLIKLRPSEAVVVLRMCTDKLIQNNLTEYELFLTEKYKNILHQELTNI